MKLIKKANILQLILLILVFSSCKKETISKQLSSSNEANTLPKMIPRTDKEAELSDAYKKSISNKIEDFYTKNWPNHKLNGGFLVAKNGQIIYEKYEGFSNFRNKTLMTANSPLHLASVSKVLTASAILLLINSEKLDLDQKVNTVLNSFPYTEITIRTLLNHRSGLSSYSYFTDKQEIWDKHKILTNEAILKILTTKKIPLESKTNTKFAYCNTNYVILALIIEKITGLKYKEAMKQMIFEPLGMKNTFVMDYEKDRDSVSPSYKGNNGEIGMDNLDAIYGDKNIYSTPRDLLKFDRARNASTFLKPELLKKVYKGYSNEHKGIKNYGLGIRMVQWETGRTLYYHNGWWHGSTTSYVPLKDENVTLIALSNKFTRSSYNIRKLSVLFGDYPFNLDEAEKEE
jgi:CubicO group peptidase (beta-lactamase class C family)